MVEIIKIFDSTTQSNIPNYSNIFQNSDFLLLDTPDLESNEGYFLSLSIIINIPLIGSKEIFLSEAAGDTGLLLRIPQEFSYQKFNQQLLILTTEEIRLRIYSISLNCTLPEIKDLINNLAENIKDLSLEISQIKLILNQINSKLNAITANPGNSIIAPNSPPINQPSLPSSNNSI